MSNIYCNIIKALFLSDLVGVRILLALSELIWFIALIWPGDTFSRPTYTIMGHIAKEEVWACVWLFSALIQAYIVFTGKFHDQFAVAFSAFNSILWWFAVISMYLSVYPPPAAISAEFGIAVGAAWIFIRSGWTVQEQYRERLHKRKDIDYAYE